VYTFRVSWTDRRVAAFLGRLVGALEQGRVHVAEYAATLAAEELGWDRVDILLLLQELVKEDFRHAEPSEVHQGDTVLVFTPEIEGHGRLWIRLVERNGVVVVSFHRA
jgi:hypothetical protein